MWSPSPRPPIRMRVLIGEEGELWEVGEVEEGGEERGRCSKATRAPGMLGW